MISTPQRHTIDLLDTAIAYQRADLCVLPAILKEKRPAVPRWKEFQEALPTEHQIRSHFSGNPDALCLLTGRVSLNLEMIDFDLKGELFDAWHELVAGEEPELIERLVIERSQSGGRHAIYRCNEPVPGSRKLAQRTITTSNEDSVTIGGKRHVPRKVGHSYQVTLTLIEPRGEGGLFLCAPSPGYELEQGALDDVPVLSPKDRSILIEAALALNQVRPAVIDSEYCERDRNACNEGRRPGDEYNERGDVQALLHKHDWTLTRPGENEYWRRPGKDHGWSATLKDRVFFVFSSNCWPFEPHQPYSPFQVYTLLEHRGNHSDAATQLRHEGFGDDGVSVSSVPRVVEEPRSKVAVKNSDPGVIPDGLLYIPGFVGNVMDECLATAPYPNKVMAFCGALALQSFLPHILLSSRC